MEKQLVCKSFPFKGYRRIEDGEEVLPICIESEKRVKFYEIGRKDKNFKFSIELYNTLSEDRRTALYQFLHSDLNIPPPYQIFELHQGDVWQNNICPGPHLFGKSNCDRCPGRIRGIYPDRDVCEIEYFLCIAYSENNLQLFRDLLSCINVERFTWRLAKRFFYPRCFVGCMPEQQKEFLIDLFYKVKDELFRLEVQCGWSFFFYMAGARSRIYIIELMHEYNFPFIGAERVDHSASMENYPFLLDKGYFDSSIVVQLHFQLERNEIKMIPLTCRRLYDIHKQNICVLPSLFSSCVDSLIWNLFTHVTPDTITAYVDVFKYCIEHGFLDGSEFSKVSRYIKSHNNTFVLQCGYFATMQSPELNIDHMRSFGIHIHVHNPVRLGQNASASHMLKTVCEIITTDKYWQLCNAHKMHNKLLTETHNFVSCPPSTVDTLSVQITSDSKHIILDDNNKCIIDDNSIQPNPDDQPITVIDQVTHKHDAIVAIQDDTDIDSICYNIVLSCNKGNYFQFRYKLDRNTPRISISDIINRKASNIRNDFMADIIYDFMEQHDITASRIIPKDKINSLRHNAIWYLMQSILRDEVLVFNALIDVIHIGFVSADMYDCILNHMHDIHSKSLPCMDYFGCIYNRWKSCYIGYHESNILCSVLSSGTPNLPVIDKLVSLGESLHAVIGGKPVMWYAKGESLKCILQAGYYTDDKYNLGAFHMQRSSWLDFRMLRLVESGDYTNLDTLCAYLHKNGLPITISEHAVLMIITIFMYGYFERHEYRTGKLERYAYMTSGSDKPVLEKDTKNIDNLRRLFKYSGFLASFLNIPASIPTYRHKDIYAFLSACDVDIDYDYNTSRVITKKNSIDNTDSIKPHSNRGKFGAINYSNTNNIVPFTYTFGNFASINPPQHSTATIANKIEADKEVQSVFSKLVDDLTEKMTTISFGTLFRLNHALRESDFQTIVKKIISTYRNEGWAHQEEVHVYVKKDGTAGDGRADLIMYNKDVIIIIELKYYCQIQISTDRDIINCVQKPIRNKDMYTQADWSLMAQNQLDHISPDSIEKTMECKLSELLCSYNSIGNGFQVTDAQQVIDDAIKQVTYYACSVKDEGFRGKFSHIKTTDRIIYRAVICGFGLRIESHITKC